MNKRIAAIVGIVVFTVLAGSGIGYAVWTANAQATGTVQSASLSTNCSAPVKLVNGGFENPNITTIQANAPYLLIGPPFIPGWSVVNDNAIEVWRSQLGSTPPEGAQVVELSGNALGTSFQVIDTTPGQLLRWSLKHRGRDGNDTMRVSINADGAALVQQAQFTTSNAAWVQREGMYVVPAGQTRTRISLTAVANANGNLSIGNLIDDVTFGTGPCLNATSTITNVTNGGGTYAVGNIVEYITTVTNTGGGHSGSTVFTAAVPAGLTYQAGSIQINGLAMSDGTNTDQAEISGGTITARLGQGASGTVGGAISPDNSVTVRFRATIQAAAAGGNLSYTSSTAYRDPLAPNWPLSAASPTLTTPVVAAPASADIGVVVATLPQLGPNFITQPRQWTFTLTNNGPSVATGVGLVVNVPSNMNGRSVAVSGGVTCTTLPNGGTSTSTCNVGDMASGSSRTVTFTGTLQSNPMNQYTVQVTATSSTPDPGPSPNSATATVLWDNQNPQPASNLTATRASETQINLQWQVGNDNVAVAGYNIYRNGVLVATTAGVGNTFSDTGLASHQPYWYWVQTVDTAGNVSTVSPGAGAVTFAVDTSYRIQNLNTPAMCLAAASAGNGAALQIQSCTSASESLRQWRFAALATPGNNVYVRFNTGTDRRWTVANNTSGTDIFMSAGGATGDNLQWNMGAYWTGSAAVLEMRRTTSTGLCLDIDGASTTAGAAVQQWTCNQTIAQRFALLQP